MYRKTLITILIVLFISVSSLIYPYSVNPTFEYLVAFYPEILSEVLGDINYTIYEQGDDYYLVEINGVTYIVKA